MSARKGKDNMDNVLQTYFDRIKGIPLLGFEEELELSRRIQKGDGIARQRLIEANLRLVIKIARAYLSPNISFMDIIQEGNIGLMRAVDKYDHVKNVRFSTYAGWWIRQAINRFMVNKRRVIRLPHQKEEVLKKIQWAYHRLSQNLMRQPKTSEIAAEIGVPAGDVEYLVGIANGFISINGNSGEETSAMMDIYEDYTYSPEQALMRQVSRDLTMEALNRLKDREKRILMYRYQLNGNEHYTLKRISAKLGISPETVRQIEMRALRKMRSQAEELKAYI
jgi:RNA polymerase primary sigma factor